MSDSTHGPALRQVLHPVPDVPAAVDFYTSVLGFETKFVDGDHYAALDANGVTLALVGPDEDVTNGRQAPGIKVSDIEAAVHAAVEAGGRVVMAPTRGQHETTAVVADPWGHSLVFYQPAG